MRILFNPNYLGYLNTNQAITPVTGVPMSVPYSMDDMRKDLPGATDNVGNIIHIEAPARMLEYDRANSASTSLSGLLRAHGRDPVSTAKFISERFDYFVISEANVLRRHGRGKEESEKSTGRLKINAEVLDNLTIPFVILGAGIQNIPPVDLEEFDSNIAAFLRVVDKKAKLLGVRGRVTRDWLVRAGVGSTVKALGCPSMFLYPNSIRNIQYTPLTKDSRVLSAGYLNKKYVKSSPERIDLIDQLSKTYNIDYVMQTDYYQMMAGEKLNHYNEASGVVDREFVTSKLKEFGYTGHNIKNFYHFRNSYAWRALCSTYDAYIGDRLHGGICAMQSGRPAVILHGDYRVRELANLFQFPSISVKDAYTNGMAAEINKNYSEESIRKFKDTYEAMYSNFREAIQKAGLKLRKP